jgi:hypothetical protein
MATEATSFITRHVRGITTAMRAFLSVMADMCNSNGRTRVTVGTVSGVLEITRRQGERHVRSLRERGVIARQGRTWVIVGVANHDIATCEHEWCVRQYARKCRPKGVSRPRRYADRGGWDQLAAQRPPQLVTAVLDAASADPRPPRTLRKYKRSKHHRPP